MFSTKFRRPIGAAADAKELEYITALHQTIDENEDDFVDGSIEAKDVKYYLMSRYGIDVTVEQIQKFVFGDLAGGSSETDCIDICELVAILLIPFFVKCRKDDDGDLMQRNITEKSLSRAFSSQRQMKSYLDDIQLCDTLFSKGAVIEHVFNIIMADSTGSAEPQPITKELITTIFARYDELGLIDDDELIQEMIDVVSGGEPNALFDAESFSRALTDDILLYDVSTETRVSTFYEDAFGRGDDHDDHDNDDDDDDNYGNETNPIVPVISHDSDAIEVDRDPENVAVKVVDTPLHFTNVFTFSQVDFLSDSCRSKMHLAIAYLSFIFAIFFYRRADGVQEIASKVCYSSSFGCQIGRMVTTWILIMTLTISFGLPFILTVTMGNTLRGKNIINPIVGIAGVIWFTLVPAVVPFDFIWLSNETRQVIEGEELDGWERRQVIFVTLLQSLIVAILLFIQITNLIRIAKPSLAYSSNPKLSFFMTRGVVRETFLLKVAASLKTHNMVKNALDLHFGEGGADSIEPTQSSTNAFALLNYSKVTEKTETVGGLWWCWKSYIDRSLIQKEGVIVNSRLILCNILQFCLIVLLCFQMPKFTQQVVSPAIFPTLTHDVKECDESTFDPSKCFFPTIVGTPTGMGICHGVRMEDPTCVSDRYFTPLLGDDDRRTYVCEGMLNFLDNANATAWSLILYGDESQKFIELSTNLVGTVLCAGLHDFNKTVWDALSGIGPMSNSCNVPQASFCDAVQGLQTSSLDYQGAMDSLLLSYEDRYRRVFQPAIECLEQQATTINALNYVFNQATDSLQEVLGSSVEASWSALFPYSTETISQGFGIDEQVKAYLNLALGPEIVDELLEGMSIMNKTEINEMLSTPVLSSVSDIILIESTAMNLIEAMFAELNVTLTATTKSITSKFEVLPSYVNLPYLPVKTLCSNIYNVRYNSTLLVTSVDSEPDHYCRSHLTTCTTTGICLLGLDLVQQGELNTYFPFQFSGQKCSEYDKLDKIMETKGHLGTITSYIPSTLLINFSIGMGVVISIVCLIAVTALFIPNAILTSLKFRSGVLPSLRDKRFKRYRKNLATLTLLVPVGFWSAFAMTFIFFFAVCLAFFILFWKATRTLIIQLIALIIGAVTTLLMKQMLVCALGKYCYAAFYRRKPALINVASIALECWHIFLSVAFVASRAGILIFMSLLFIGRVDRPILAEDLELDKFPYVFRQAILASDAHRHPYIERLGMMYLMKLKHGSKFGKKSSSIWRLVFVFALMPWLRKYRIIDDVTDVDRAKIDDAFELVKHKSNEIVELKERIAMLEKELQLAHKKDQGERDSILDDSQIQPRSPLSCM